MIAKFLDEV